MKMVRSCLFLPLSAQRDRIPAGRAASRASAPSSRPATPRDFADAASVVAERLAPTRRARVRGLAQPRRRRRGRPEKAWSSRSSRSWASSPSPTRSPPACAAPRRGRARAAAVARARRRRRARARGRPRVARRPARTLRTDGVYAVVRHPICSGALIACGALSAITGSAPRRAHARAARRAPAQGLGRGRRAARARRGAPQCVRARRAHPVPRHGNSRARAGKWRADRCRD